MSLRGWALWGSVSGIEYACVCKLKEREQKVVLWEEKKKRKNFIERDWDFHHLSIKLFHISPCQHSTRLNYQTRQGPFVLTHATFISIYLQLFFLLLLLLLFYFPQNLHKQCMNTTFKWKSLFGYGVCVHKPKWNVQLQLLLLLCCRCFFCKSLIMRKTEATAAFASYTYT